MMSTCIKKRLGGEGVSLNYPFMEYRGLYQGFACRHPCCLNLFNPLRDPHPSVECALSSHLWCPLLRVTSLPPSVFLPSVNMQYRGHAGDPELPVAEQRPPSTAAFYSSKRLSSDNNIFCFKTAAPSLLSLVDSMYRLEMFLSWVPPPPKLPSSLHCVCFSLQGYLLFLFWC